MENEVLNLKQAAKLLGTSQQTVKEILEFFNIEHKQFGRRFFITKRSLLDFIDGGSKDLKSLCESKQNDNNIENK